jgi:hypothetical protein
MIKITNLSAIKAIDSIIRAAKCRLSEFWNRTDARISVGIARIAIYSALLHAVDYHSVSFPSDLTAWLALKSPTLWQPHGLARIFAEQPSANALWLIIAIAKLSTIAAIVGLGGRAVQVTSALSASLLVGIHVSWSPYWSHAWNINCLAALAFMFARGGAFSADNAIRRMIGLRVRTDAPLWPVLLAQASVALMLFAAFYAKLGLFRGEFTLSWMFSDNIRNAITFPYSIFGYTMPSWLHIVVANPALYIGSAVAHMVMQGAPILAIFTTKPYLRLIEGLLFLAGALLLYLVMTLGNWSWFLLAVLFVDWEYFFGRASASQARGWSMPARAFTAAYVSLFVAVAFFDSRFNKGFYPFSPMDFYSTVMDRVSLIDRIKALSFTHKGFGYWAGDVYSTQRDGTVNYYRNYNDAYNHAITSSFEQRRDYVHSLAKQLKAATGAIPPTELLAAPWAPWRYYPEDTPRFIETGMQRLDVWAAVYSIPAAPKDPTKRELLARGLVGSYDAERDIVRLATTQVTFPDPGKAVSRITVRTEGFTNPEISFWYVADPINADGPQELRPLPGRWAEDGYEPIKPDLTPYYVIITRISEGDQVFDFWGAPLYERHLSTPASVSNAD